MSGTEAICFEVRVVFAPDAPRVWVQTARVGEPRRWWFYKGPPLTEIADILAIPLSRQEAWVPVPDRDTSPGAQTPEHT